MSNILGIQGWSVSVEVDAETILTIGHNSLSGIDDFTDAQAQVIRNCAEHLLAFIGSPRATPTPLADAAAIAEREAQQHAVGADGLCADKLCSFAWVGPHGHNVPAATTEAPMTDAAVGKSVEQNRVIKTRLALCIAKHPEILEPHAPMTDAIAPTEGAKPVAQVYSAIERGDEWDYKVQRIRILDGANLNDGDLLYADAPAQTADVAQGAKSHQSKINPRVWLDDGGQPDSISGYDIGLGRP